MALNPEALAEYRRCFRKPENIAASCADYRAGYNMDNSQDREDRAAAGKSPVLLVVTGEDVLKTGPNSALETWKRWAADVRGQVLACGHFVMEEKPQETLAALLVLEGMSRAQPPVDRHQHQRDADRHDEEAGEQRPCPEGACPEIADQEQQDRHDAVRTRSAM